MLKRFAVSLCVIVAATLSAGVHATTVSADGSNLFNWLPFDVDDFTALNSGLDWIDIGNGSKLNFTLTGPAILKVVDSGFAGDVFEVFDNGISLGTTSVATNTFDTFALGTTQTDFDLAFADARFSKGEYLLGAGSHSITGLLSSTTVPFNATVGGIQVSVVPLPPAIFALLSGLGLFAGFLRRRFA